MLSFAVAMPMKTFALLLLIPILLLRQKNLLKVLGSIALVMLPQIITGLLFYGDLYYTMVMKPQNSDAINLLIASGTFGNIKVSVFTLLYGLLCYWCFSYRYEGTKQDRYTILYVAFLSMAALVCGCAIRSYWIILYVPFLTALTMLQEGKKTVALLIDTVAGVTGALYYLLTHWIYSTTGLCNSLIWKEWTVPKGMELKFGSFATMWDKLGLSRYTPVLQTMFFASILGAVVLFRPSRRSDAVEEQEKKHACDPTYALLLWGRTVLPLMLCTAILYSAFALTAVPANTVYSGGEKGSVDLLRSETTCFPLDFSTQREITRLELPLYSERNKRNVRSVLTVSLYDITEGYCLWEDTFGVSLIQNDRDMTFKLPHVAVDPAHQYELRFDAGLLERRYEAKAYPCLTETGELVCRFR